MAVDNFVYHINTKTVDYETFVSELLAQIVEYYAYDVVFNDREYRLEYFSKKFEEALDDVENFGEVQSLGRYDFWADRGDEAN